MNNPLSPRLAATRSRRRSLGRGALGRSSPAIAVACIGLILALCAGCVDEKKEIARYQKELDALPGTADPAPDDSPLTLQQAMRLAEKNDESLATSGESYLQALYAKDRAFSAFLPQISLGPNVSVSNIATPVHSKTVTVGADIKTSVFSVVNQAELAKSAANVELSRQNLFNEQQIILEDVASAYYTVLQFERSVLVDQNSLTEQDERVRQAEAQFRLGNGTPLAVAQSRSLASQTRVQLISDRAGVTTSRDLLSFLIGFPVGERPLVDDFQPPRETVKSVEDWLADAMAHRQDLIASASAVEAARQGVRSAFGEYVPTVSLDIAHLIYNERPPLTQIWTGALSVNIPVFTGGQIEADVHTALSQLRSAVLSQNQTRKTVEQNVRDAYANYISSRDQIAELRIELKASRDALVFAQREFAVGLATNLDVLTATDTLLSTQLQLARQVYQKKIDYMNLLRNAGHLTFDDAAPTTRPSTEPSDLETTTPEVVGPSTLP